MPTSSQPRRWWQPLSASLPFLCMSWGLLAAPAAPQDLKALGVPAANAPLEEQARFWTNFPTFSYPSHNSCKRAVGTERQFCDMADVDNAVFNHSPSSFEITLPSLWWTRDQLPRRLGARRLVQSWAAYRLQQTSNYTVDVFLDTQIWSILNTYEHYSVLNQFGSVTKASGYHLRLYRGQGRSAQLAGIYLCQFDDLNQASAELSQAVDDIPCEATIDRRVLERYELVLD